MKRPGLSTLLAGLLVACALAVVLALSLNNTGDSDDPIRAQQVAADTEDEPGDQPGDEPEDDTEGDSEDDGEGGLGPPPWAANDGSDDRADKADKSQGKADKSQGKGHAWGRSADKHAWKAEWKALSPEEKAERMEAIAAAHAEAMLEWEQCVTDAGSDVEARGSCEKPMPPGHVKKLP